MIDAFAVGSVFRLMEEPQRIGVMLLSLHLISIFWDCERLRLTHRDSGELCPKLENQALGLRTWVELPCSQEGSPGACSEHEASLPGQHGAQSPGPVPAQLD